jgi:hypothetical protein
MRSDLYLKIVLTIIAACLVALTFRSVSLIPGVRAATETRCTGEMNATSTSAMQASLGASYKIDVPCR